MSVIIVSWILILLSLFGVTYAHDIRGESQLVRLSAERQQLQAWARSGVAMARARLEVTPGKALYLLGAVDPENPFLEPLACGRGWFAVGHDPSGTGSGEWSPGLADEQGRIPVALADSTTLALLPGMTREGINAVLAAREKAGRTRVPPFAQLPGMDASSLASCSRYLSRYGEAVNLNAATAEVLVALGLTESAVTKLLRWRAGKDKVHGTFDDRMYEALAETDLGIASIVLNSEEAAILAYLASSGRLVLHSQYYSLSARGWAEGYHGICQIHAVMKRTEMGAVEIQEWTESWLN
jgi:hypothetical protein